jgi:transposase, IS5 family
MRPPERRETGEQDPFRSRLDQIIDLKHPLAALGRTVDWEFLEREFGAVYTDDPGRPPLPTRLMAGLAILKHTHDLSDEVLCERWVRTLITSSSAARSSSSIGWCSIARR